MVGEHGANVKLRKMDKATGKPTFKLTLEALPDDLRPPEVRLRQILKLCLRGFRMRCTEVSQANASSVCDVPIEEGLPLLGCSKSRYQGELRGT